MAHVYVHQFRDGSGRTMRCRTTVGTKPASVRAAERDLKRIEIEGYVIELEALKRERELSSTERLQLEGWRDLLAVHFSSSTFGRKSPNRGSSRSGKSAATAREPSRTGKSKAARPADDLERRLAERPEIRAVIELIESRYRLTPGKTWEARYRKVASLTGARGLFNRVRAEALREIRASDEAARSLERQATAVIAAGQRRMGGGR